MKNVRPRHGQLLDRGRLKNRTGHLTMVFASERQQHRFKSSLVEKKEKMRFRQWFVSFSALSLLVDCQKQHMTCRKLRHLFTKTLRRRQRQPKQNWLTEVHLKSPLNGG